jgi:hypothetical protein
MEEETSPKKKKDAPVPASPTKSKEKGDTSLAGNQDSKDKCKERTSPSKKAELDKKLIDKEDIEYEKVEPSLKKTIPNKVEPQPKTDAVAEKRTVPN